MSAPSLDGRPYLSIVTADRGFRSTRAGLVRPPPIAASAPETARTSVRPRCYSQSRTPPPDVWRHVVCSDRSHVRFAALGAGPAPGGGVHFSVHRPTTPARHADRR